MHYELGSVRVRMCSMNEVHLQYKQGCAEQVRQIINF